MHMASDVCWVLMSLLDGEAIMSLWMAVGLVCCLGWFDQDKGGAVYCGIMNIGGRVGAPNDAIWLVYMCHMWVHNQVEWYNKW